jgi:hypothetical protein
MRVLGLTLERVWPGSHHLAVDVKPWCAAWRSECGRVMCFAPRHDQSAWTIRVVVDRKARCIEAPTLAQAHIAALESFRDFEVVRDPRNKTDDFEKTWFHFLRRAFVPSRENSRLHEFYKANVFAKLAHYHLDPDINFIGDELTDYLCRKPLVAFTERRPSIVARLERGYEGETGIEFLFVPKEWKATKHIDAVKTGLELFARQRLIAAETHPSPKLDDETLLANAHRTIEWFLINELGDADTSENQWGLKFIDSRWSWTPREPDDLKPNPISRYWR